MEFASYFVGFIIGFLACGMIVVCDDLHTLLKEKRKKSLDKKEDNK